MVKTLHSLMFIIKKILHTLMTYFEEKQSVLEA